MNQVIFQDKGRIQYKEAWDLQEELLKENTSIKLAAGRDASPHEVPTKNYLLFCEHNPVYTLGKSGSIKNLLLNEEGLEAKGIEYFKINRGGDITYHGPGQITGYPIFDLEKFKPDLNWYLRTMEDAVINLLADYGLHGERSKGETGVWLDVGKPNARKICAIGVRCSRWVTMHGFAFNVNTDLNYFKYIIPCGITDKDVTSLQAEVGRELDYEVVKEELKVHLAKAYNYAYLADDESLRQEKVSL
jgi:lipoyl(octanoyl) transferase